jgi:hypothetical protein
MSAYTEDHLVEQPAIQLMQHELGWDVVNCYDEWSGGVSNQGRDGKREGGNIEHRTTNIEHRSEEKRRGGSGGGKVRSETLWQRPAARRHSHFLLDDRFNLRLVGFRYPV